MATIRAAVLLLMGLFACGRSSSTDAPAIETAAPVTAKVPTPSKTATRAFDLVSALPHCDVYHHGLLLDFGSAAMDGREPWRLGPNPDIANVEREGATWARITGRSISLLFPVDEAHPLTVKARIRGISSQSAAVLLDEKPWSTLTFSRNQSRTVSASVTSTALVPVAPGVHTLTLRFSGKATAGDAFAELDWLRIGPANEEEPPAYASPTQRDVAQNVALSGLPHRTLSLRAPSSLRCSVGVAPGARLRTAIGLQGNGDGEAEIRLLRDGQPPTVLQSLRVLGGDRATWTDLDLPLPSVANELVTTEFSVISATHGARVLFGDPSVLVPPETIPPPPPAKVVLLVVLASLDPARLSPKGPSKPLPNFEMLAREGVVFSRHRSPSTVISSTMASLLTGLSPRRHTVEDPYARLPATWPTLGTLARDGSVHTAMFTAHPATFEAFGFGRGWDKFVAHSPVSPSLATLPFDDLLNWISDSDSVRDPNTHWLGVAHGRGIHPPYDVTPADYAQLPPVDYAGPVEPRRTGQVLERMRRKKNAPKWTDHDARRLASLLDGALVANDQGLGRLVDGLRKAGLWEDTLLVVTSDVASAADPAALPFAEALELAETALHVPLYVHFPHQTLAGTRVETPTTSADIFPTVLSALGLHGATAGEKGWEKGRDLFSLASQPLSPLERPLEATLPERFATRWGDLRLSGREGQPPFLCRVTSDQKCEHDLRTSLPLATLALWRWTYEQEAFTGGTTTKKLSREPATIDPETAAALAVWGKLSGNQVKTKETRRTPRFCTNQDCRKETCRRPHQNKE